MVVGCLNIRKDALFRQGNNVMEMHDGPPLNMCNVTAIVMAWAAVTHGFDQWRNPWGGTWRIQPEDAAYIYLHDEINTWPRLMQIRPLALCHGQPPAATGPYPPEQVPQYHQAALRDVFGLGADFSFAATFSHVAGEVSRRVACILRLKAPGHYVTAVAYNEEKQLIGFKDPAPVKWLQNTEDADGNKWMTADDFKTNVNSDVTRAWRL